jgi:flavin reductase (DIM6/NTAB) family NADH-FMN oxidoreductase RutF
MPHLVPVPGGGADEIKELRSTLGMFATGITVVTAAGPEAPCGMTANSFTSVSMSPPLVLVCVLRDAKVHEAILQSGAFGVSVLSAHQATVAKHFANKARPRGEQEFDVVDWVPGRHTGAPIVSNTLAWLECRLTAVYDGGDHSIFLGSVLESGRDGNRNALLFFGGGFHSLEAEAS